MEKLKTFPSQGPLQLKYQEHRKAMTTLEATVENIFATRRITRYDQQLLMQFFSQSGLSSTDKHCIDRVYEALSRGLLRVVD